MDTGRLGHTGPIKEATIGDLVICVDVARRDHSNNSHRFIGLVLDKSITVYKILIVETGQEAYWPQSATYLWKETK